MVPGSIPGSVNEYFSDIFLPTVPWPWGRLSPYWKWVPGIFPGVREADNLTHLHVPNVMEIWGPKPPRTLSATTGLLRDCFNFTFSYTSDIYFEVTTTVGNDGHVLADTHLHVWYWGGCNNRGRFYLFIYCSIGAQWLLNPRVYRLFATRVSQPKIWHFLVTGIERNVCRCTFNRYSA